MKFIAWIKSLFHTEREPNWNMINADMKARAMNQEQDYVKLYGNVKGVK